jgi:hypothetical protein
LWSAAMASGSVARLIVADNLAQYD